MQTIFYLILEHPTNTMCRSKKQTGTTDWGIFDCLHSGPGLWKEPWQAEVSSGYDEVPPGGLFSKAHYGPLSMPVIDVY